MTTENKAVEKEYYYVNYRIYPGNAPALDAVIVLPQNKIEGGGDNPDGFGFTEATEYLFSIYGLPVLIHSWRQVTERRYLQFQEFSKRILGPEKPEKPRPSHLTLVSNPNEAT